MVGALHPETRRIGERYGCERAPIVRVTVVLVEVGKLPRQTRKPKKLWLWWSGEGDANLDLLWKAYCRRFDLEYTLRFLKQPWAGPLPGSGIPSRRTGGRGWWWPLSPSLVWRGRALRIGGCRGRGATTPAA